MGVVCASELVEQRQLRAVAACRRSLAEGGPGAARAASKLAGLHGAADGRPAVRAAAEQVTVESLLALYRRLGR